MLNLAEVRTKGVRTAKFSDDQVQFVLTSLASYEPSPKITKKFQEKFGLVISNGAVEYYRHAPRYNAIIQREQKKYESSISEVAIASKRWRVMNLLKMYEELMKDGEIMHALAVSKEAREETGGGRTNVFGDVYAQSNTYNQYADMSDGELISKLKDNMQKMKIIDGEVLPEDTSNGKIK